MKSYSKGRSTYKFGATICNFKARGDKNVIQKQTQVPLVMQAELLFIQPSGGWRVM